MTVVSRGHHVLRNAAEYSHHVPGWLVGGPEGVVGFDSVREAQQLGACAASIACPLGTGGCGPQRFELWKVT
jgi:hypothetical protein